MKSQRSVGFLPLSEYSCDKKVDNETDSGNFDRYSGGSAPFDRPRKSGGLHSGSGKVPNNKLAIAVYTNEGEVIKAGDADESFSIQSISKALSLTLAMCLYKQEEIWARVGKEPSGQAFNSLIQLEMEQGIPRNPFINAGAIVVADLLQSRLSAPRQRLLEFVRQLSGDTHIVYDKVVAASEMMHGDRNAAIAYLMRSFGNFENEVIPVLQNYFHACALKMSCGLSENL